jgi:hypothetical protein
MKRSPVAQDEAEVMMITTLVGMTEAEQRQYQQNDDDDADGRDRTFHGEIVELQEGLKRAPPLGC